MSNDPRSRIDEQALGWFVRLRDEPVGEADRASFAKWRLADPAHARAFDELNLLWSDLGDVPDVVRDAPAFEAARPRRRSHRAGLGGIAAVFGALALTFGSYGALAPPGGIRALFADVRTAPGETKDLMLPDGTQVRLAGASALSYEVGTQDRRVTMIAGRAFFNVRHERSRPFRVFAASAEIRDIGTAFEVATGSRQSSVAVAQGQVDIALAGGGATSLRAGQRIAFGKSLGPVTTLAPRDVAPWRNDRMLFDNAPLKDVLAELESDGAGRIVLLDPALGKKRLTGAFDTRRPRQALEAVAAITGARVTSIGPVTFVAARSSDKNVARP
jgi:transmembrane sensor